MYAFVLGIFVFSLTLCDWEEGWGRQSYCYLGPCIQKVVWIPAVPFSFDNTPYYCIYFKIKIWCLVYNKYIYASLGFMIIISSICGVLVLTSYSLMLRSMIFLPFNTISFTIIYT